MNKFCLSVIGILVAICCLAADNVVVDNIRYTLQKNNTLSCAAANKGALVDVVIPDNVRLNGIDYYVGSVERDGFRKCKSLKSIDLPNTIKRIGSNAFEDCKNLESVIMPDDAQAVINPGTYGYGRQGIFKGCVKLSNVSGHEVPYPRYVIYDAFYDCTEVPFYNTILAEGSANLTARTFQSADFTSFASSRLKKAVEEWQVRKPYETIAQWENRVDEASRKAMIDETIATLKHEYVSKYAPRSLRGKIGDYVRDFEFFPIELGGSLGSVYASVPIGDSQIFKSSWSDVVIEPVYGVMDGNIAVLSCKFLLNGKEYTSARSYAEDDFTPMALNIAPLSAVKEYEQLAQSEGSKVSTKQFVPDVVDIDIPETDVVNSLTFAVIIGNENYQRVANVDFAANDAKVFARYCKRTLGIPETNIRTYYDATYGDMVAAMRDIKDIASAYDGKIKVMLYYAGHGVPDESNRNAYILPVDASGTDMDACYPLNKLYEELGSLNAESVIAFVDACFSGSLRGDGMLASARGIRLRPRDIQTTGNLVVLSAASGDQSALPYNEKGHGIFTYYLLDKLNSTRGDVNIGELCDYITTEVARQSVVVNRKLQTPTVKYSPMLVNDWRSIRLVQM